MGCKPRVPAKDRPCYRCNKRPRGGNKSWCKPCRNEYSRSRRPKHRDLPEHERLKANCRSYTNQLIKRGALVRKPCEHCAEARTEAHHEDYSKPRQVVWLCRPCHLSLHKRRAWAEEQRRKRKERRSRVATIREAA